MNQSKANQPNSDKPHTIRLHVNCAVDSIDTSQEPKIETAIQRAKG
jgi:hypothetical protein